MKKYIIITLLGAYNLLLSMHIVQLPPCETLRKNLRGKGFDPIIPHIDYKRTDFYPEGVEKIYDIAATCYYFQSGKTAQAKKDVIQWKPLFIKAVFANNPKAIHELKKKRARQ